MIDREQNPEFINSFLDYSITILNKSPNSIKEYNYDLAMFFKYMNTDNAYSVANSIALENSVHTINKDNNYY